MRKILFFLSLVFVFNFTLNAQNFSTSLPKIKVIGKVKDNDKNNIPFANIAFYKLPDSTLVGGGISDDKGNFEYELSLGKYFAQITFIAFNKHQTQTINLTENLAYYDLGTIVLSPSSTLLNEVEIVAEKSQMELQLDKRVFNVQKDLSNTGSNASELLENIPSVEVDVDGNVSLRGSQNVRILIDGRQSGLVGMGSTDALRALSGDMIEKVEIITNPSSRYDAEGDVGIINIILKKDKNKGFNGSVSATAGYPENFGTSFNLNYRTKNYNLFASYGAQYRKTPGIGYSRQEFFFPDTSYAFERDRTHTRGGLSNNIRVGTDFYLPHNQTLTASVLYKYSDGNNKATNTYTDFYRLTDEILNKTERIDEESELQNNYEFALNYTKKFPKKGHELIADLRYINSDDLETSDITEGPIGIPNLALNQRSSNVEFEENFVGQIDYVYPFLENGKLEAGAKTSLRNLKNDFSVEQLNAGTWDILPPFDNTFIYVENIHAAYVMAGNKFNKTSIQAGLRGEFSDVSTKLVKTNQVNPRKYFNLFPSVHSSYEINKTTSIQISYARRISRPRFRQLLPFFNYSDSRNFFSGNPNINPEFTDSYEAGYLKYFNKGNIFTSVYYRHTNQVVEWILQVDTTGFTRRFPANIGTNDAYGFEITGAYDITSKLKLNGNANFFKSVTQGNYLGQHFFAETYTMTSRGVIKYSLPKNIQSQVSINYRAPRESIQGKTLALYSIDFGLSKELFAGKGNLNIAVRDVFNTRKRRSISYGDTFYNESTFQWATRQFTVNFSYFINQNKKQQRDKDRGDGWDGGMDSGEM